MKKIGIVCSGGMAKGAYQIGVFRALSKWIRPEEVSVVSAASVGALNSYAFFSGQLDAAASLWIGINDEKPRVSLASLLKSPRLYDTIRTCAVHPVQCGRFFVPLLDPFAREIVYRDLAAVPQGEMHEWLNAVIAVLGFRKPHPVGGRSWFDGAAVDNIPVFPLLTDAPDYLICIYFDSFNYVFDTPDFDSRVIKISFEEDDTLLTHSFRFRREDILRDMAEGERRASEVLAYVFADGMEKDHVLPRIAALNENHPKRRLRLTGDTVLNNLNRITAHLTARRLADTAIPEAYPESDTAAEE